MAFVLRSIFSPFFAISASLLPMKTWIISFGLAIVVASAKMRGLTVAMVESAPLESEYGRGHKRIITRSFSPSCLRTSERAAKRESFATRRLTNWDRRVRERRKEHKEPTIVAEAPMNQLVSEQILESELYHREIISLDEEKGADPFGKPHTNPAMVRQLE